MFDAQMSLFGVIGNPIRHSGSPRIHQHFARQVGLYIDYKRIYAEEADFEASVERFFRGGGLGLNVTLPFKGDAALFATELSARARLVGVVNTLHKTEDGVFGDTTDGQGFLSDVKRLAPASAFDSILILGAGGAVRGLLPDVLSQNPKKLVILNRTASRALGLIDEVESWRAQLGFDTELSAGGYELDLGSEDFSLVVQGASGEFQFQQELNLSNTFCYDLNYGSRSTSFIAWAKSRGAEQTSDGLGMLVGQAAASFQLWTGQCPDIGATMDYMKSANPWMDDWWQPPFNSLASVTLSDAVLARLKEKEALFEQRLQDLEQGLIPLTWDSLVRCYEEADDQLQRVWKALVHLNKVQSSTSVQAAHNQLHGILTEHYAHEHHNSLHRALLIQLFSSSACDSVVPARRKWFENRLRDFKHFGADLAVESQQRVVALQRELIELSDQYADLFQNVTDDWFLDVTEDSLEGVPEHNIAVFRAAYVQVNGDGGERLCRISLQDPCFDVVMSFCRDQGIRKQVYDSWATRASGESEFGENALGLMNSLLRKRQELAQVLGFEHYAAYALHGTMAKSDTNAVQFLESLASDIEAKVDEQDRALQQFASDELGLHSLQPWDMMYVHEQCLQGRTGVDWSKAQDFFPLGQVIKGVIALVEKLFPVSCRIDYSVATYHEDVQFLEIADDRDVRGGMYLDLSARENKKSGSWVDECRQRYITAEGIISMPISYVVCNFQTQIDGMPTLLMRNDVQILFQHIGECLHHVLSEVDVAGLSGCHGVELDAKGILGQLFRNWSLQSDVLVELSGHYQSGAALSKASLQAISKVPRCNEFCSLIRQVQFGLFDLELHQQQFVAGTLCDVFTSAQKPVSGVQAQNQDYCPQALFQIFAGTHAAGYYGYMWSQVYAQDIFSEFERAGLFNLTLAKGLYDVWFSTGGVETSVQKFQDFMGRDVRLSSLL